MSDSKPRHPHATRKTLTTRKQKRGTVYGYRRRVPPDLIDKVDPPRRKLEWVESFGVVTWHEASRRAEELGAMHSALIRRLRDGESPIDAKAAAAAEIEARRIVANGPAGIEAAIDGYIARAFERFVAPYVDRGIEHRDWRERVANVPAPELAEPGPMTLSPYETAVIEGIEQGRVVPKSAPLSAVYERDKELHVPAEGRDERPYKIAVESFKTACGDLDIRAIRREHSVKWIADCRSLGQADNTIRRRAECLSALWKRWHGDMALVAANPFADLKLNAGKKKDAKLPFAPVHLQAIDAYIEKARASRRGLSRTHIIWTVLKYTGARPAEIAGLAVEDVFLNEDAPFIWIRPNALRRLKTESSQRMIPLVGPALDMMRDAVAGKESGGVFYDDGDFKWQNVSDMLNIGLRRVGIKQGRLSAGSFRHTMKQALREAKVREDLQRYALGHTGGAVADNYGAPDAMLSELKTALESAVGQLGAVNLRIYKPDELNIVPMKAGAKGEGKPDRKVA